MRTTSGAMDPRRSVASVHQGSAPLVACRQCDAAPSVPTRLVTMGRRRRGSSVPQAARTKRPSRSSAVEHTARGTDGPRCRCQPGHPCRIAVDRQSPRGATVRRYSRRRVALGVSAIARRSTEVPMIAGTEKPMAKGTPAPMLIRDNGPRYQRDHDRMIASTGVPSTIRTEETSPRGNVEPR